MAFRISDLKAAGRRSSGTVTAKSLHEAKRRGHQTAFLCHSHDDEEIAKGLQTKLAENGWDLYIDWQDPIMPENPNTETANWIKRTIIERDWFLFLATPSSVRSRWCPWEIGYADSVKSHNRIMVLPTEDDGGKFHGNEYLQLYRHISSASDNFGRKGYAIFEAGSGKGRFL